MDGSADFYRNWYNYKLGFGDLNGEFWLGNDKLVVLLQANPKNELRFDLESTTNVLSIATLMLVMSQLDIFSPCLAIMEQQV